MIDLEHLTLLACPPATEDRIALGPRIAAAAAVAGDQRLTSYAVGFDSGD
jgi:hypothetical protein